MSNNLWNRVADFFKEWDGEDMTKSMSLSVNELREINSNRIDLIRLERERKEIRNKVIDEFAEKLKPEIFTKIKGWTNSDDLIRWCGNTIDEIAEQMKEVEGKNPITYSDTNRADCPTCGATVRGISKPFGKYCSRCGQKLDWSEEDER